MFLSLKYNKYNKYIVNYQRPTTGTSTFNAWILQLPNDKKYHHFFFYFSSKKKTPQYNQIHFFLRADLQNTAHAVAGSMKMSLKPVYTSICMGFFYRLRLLHGEKLKSPLSTSVTFSELTLHGCKTDFRTQSQIFDSLKCKILHNL